MAGLRILHVLALAAAAAAAKAYKPVILMHGVGSDHHEMDTLVSLIEARGRGAVATSLPLYEKSESFLTPLGEQVQGLAGHIRSMVAANATLYADGYHLVCKSQGGLICRCVIESMADHAVDTFVSLAGPQMGVYGQDFFDSIKVPLLENATARTMWRIAYTRLGQATISDANMWHDPNHEGAYYEYDTFLPGYTDNASAAMKANFVRLRKAVFCVGSGSAYDGGIEPFQSGAWGFVDAAGAVVPMSAQPMYKEDTFGLRTLDESGRLNLTVVPGVRHGDWTGNRDVIRTWVLPHLS